MDREYEPSLIEPLTKKPPEAPARKPVRKGGARGWPDVLRAVRRPAVFSRFREEMRAREILPDSFRQGPHRALTARALTAVEDWLEDRHPRWEEDREEIRSLRRSLEDEARS